MAFAPVALVAPKTQRVPSTKLSLYTKTTMPDATLNPYCLIMLTNGGGTDAPCLAVSDGVAWFLVAVGAAVA